jgi:hypothetical protein
MKPLDPIVEGAPLEAELRAFDRACEARAEVLAMVAAWRVSVGAGPDAPPPEELRACLAVADEECTATGDAWARAVAWREAAEDATASADFAPDAEMLEERARHRAEAVGWADDTTSCAGGHYGDA